MAYGNMKLKFEFTRVLQLSLSRGRIKEIPLNDIISLRNAG
jgi:hypothetical protein